MKTIITFLVIVSITVLTSSGQATTTAPEGLIAGKGITKKTLTVGELSTISGINTTSSIQTQLDTKYTRASKRIAAYYINTLNDDYDESNIPYDSLTVLMHGSMLINTNGTITQAVTGFHEPNLITHAHAKGVKVELKISGGNSTFSAVAASSTYRTAFADTVYSYCHTYGYDGIDIDWENLADSTAYHNYPKLVKAVHDKFTSSAYPAPLWTISMAIPCNVVQDRYFYFDSLSIYTDYYNAMAYDMRMGGAVQSGPTAAIYPVASDKVGYYRNIDRGISFLLDVCNIPASKINMGIPFYGYEWTNSQGIYDDCGGTCTATQIDYKNIYPLIFANYQWIYRVDAWTNTPYLHPYSINAHLIITYDDEASVAEKVQYALIKKNLGGVFMWTIASDRIATTGKQPLFESLYNTFNLNFMHRPTWVPSDLFVTTVSSTRIDGGFTINDLGQTGHKVYISTYGSTYSLLTTLDNVTSTFSSTGLTEGTRYYFKVCAYTGSLLSDFCAPANDCTIPSAPSSLTATKISDTEIDGSFTANSTHRDGHRVYISSNGGSTYTLDQTLTGATNTFSATGLTGGTRYYFKTLAYKGNQVSTYSNIANDSTSLAFLLTATGNGTGVATLRMTTSQTQTVTITNGEVSSIQMLAGR